MGDRSPADLAERAPVAGRSVVRMERFVQGASRWSLSFVLVMPLAPFSP